MNHVIVRLEAEYCPPLDPALLSAILSDYDLESENDVQQARLILDSLKESALLEEQAGFDASGTGARDDGYFDEGRPESRPETSTSHSRETDLTTVSNGLSSLDLDAVEQTSRDRETAEDLEKLDEDTKIQLLLDVFQNRTSRYNAQYTLRKCGGNWHKAMEELLNHVYFEDPEIQGRGDNPISAKSIDGFSEDSMIRRGRKGKSKGKKLRAIDERRSSSLPVSPDSVDLAKNNKWETASKDIEFITSRTGLPGKAVTSVYYSVGASLSATIAAILKNSVENDAPSEDPILAVNTHELEVEFPSISSNYAAAIVRLTHPSTAAAHEFAKALSMSNTKAGGGIQLITNYQRPRAEELEPDLYSPALKSVAPPTALDHKPLNNAEAVESASNYAARRKAALSQAYAAHRKAKSDRLMGGAAAYYGQLGREYGAMKLRATAVAADEVAESQSSSSHVDLHGVDVLNAVRIAEEKVEQWWRNLGEDRVNGRVGLAQRQSGYRIVVGLGRHSEGGKNKLGPAVSKMLRAKGWRIESEGAVILVKGRART